MHRKSPRSIARLVMSLGIALCLFAYGGGIALAAPHAPHSTPLYVLCSSQTTKLLAQNATSLTAGAYTYDVYAYVFGKYDARQPSYYCGPIYGESEVVNRTSGSAPGGYLTVKFADEYSSATTSGAITTSGFAAYGDADALDSNGESWLCGNTTATFQPSGYTSKATINSGNGCS